MRGARRLGYHVHLYVGLTVGLLLVSAGLTGSLLVWRSEIDALLHPELLRVVPAGDPLPLQRMVAAVGVAFPDRGIAQIRPPRSPEESAQLLTAGPDPLQVYVDPYRARVLGARRPTETFANALFEWHRSLFAGKTGERVMGVAALLLLALVLSGVVVWWPGVRRLWAACTVRWSAGWKRANFDVHRAGGIWSALLLTVVSVTGASLVFKDAFMRGLDAATRSAPRPAPPVVDAGSGAVRLPLDSLVQLADAAVPGGVVTYVTLPQAVTAPLVIRKRTEGELHPNGRNFVYLDPTTGRVLQVEAVRRAPAGTRAYNILYPLHIGHWGGAASRVLYTLLGLTPLVLFVTGVAIWWTRTRRRWLGQRGRGARVEGQRAGRPESPREAA